MVQMAPSLKKSLKYKNIHSRRGNKTEVNKKKSDYKNILDDLWIKEWQRENKINESNREVFSHFDQKKSIVGEDIDFLLGCLFVLRWERRLIILLERNLELELNVRLSKKYLDDEEDMFRRMDNSGIGMFCKPITCPPGEEHSRKRGSPMCLNGNAENVHRIKMHFLSRHYCSR